MVVWLYNLWLSASKLVSGLVVREQSALPESFYDFEMQNISGAPVSFKSLEGKKVLLVNTASKCGYTDQFADLQKLHDKYQDRLEILGFPSNDFLWQEPGTDADIAQFCSLNYGVTFRMFHKISVVGKSAHPLYRWLADRSGKEPEWNFCKYFIDEKGRLLSFFNQKVNPLDPRIIDLINRD